MDHRIKAGAQAATFAPARAGLAVFSFFMSFILVFSLMAFPGGGIQPSQAFADETATGGTDTNPQDDTLTIKAGGAVPVEGQANTWQFPYLTVESNTDRKIKSITVQFTSVITPADKINVAADAANGFTLFAGNKSGNASVNNLEGATAQEWQSYLRSHMTITLADATTTKSLRMIANFEPVSSIYDYNATNGHYYETVAAAGASWQTAYRAAQAKKHMGMQGYLVTITSQQEHDYVYTMIGQNCWMGSTCLDAYTGPVKNTYKDFYASKGITIPASTMPGAAYYFWVDGPEKGKLVSYGLTNPKAAPDPSPDPANGNSAMIYNNWAPSEPNNSNGEQCMHFYTSVAGKWNDFSDTNGSCTAYVIEYGGMPGDPEDGVGEVTGGGDGNADVFVKVEIDIDPQGKTITTMADNVRVGQPLRVSENVNGNEDITKTDATGEKVPSTVTRTYYKKEDDGSWTKLDEPPTLVGTYKVESSAVYRDATETTAQEDYKTGSSQFKILPAILDVTNPAPDPEPGKPGEGDQPGTPGDPGDPGDPSQVAVQRAYTKVYDGTVNFETKRMSLADLLAKDITDAYLVFDYATYDDANVGNPGITLHNVRIEGSHAANYNLSGLVADSDDPANKMLTARGTILPREVVVIPTTVDKDGKVVSEWRANVPLGADVTNVHNIAAFDEATGNPTSTTSTNPTTQEQTSWTTGWNSDMLAPSYPGQDNAVDTVLAGVDFAYTSKTSGGLKLNKDKPQVGQYWVSAALSGDGVTFDRATNSYLVGNYRFKVQPSVLTVNKRPPAQVVDVTINKDPDVPGTKPLTPDDIKKLVEDQLGDDDPKLPEGGDPTVVITKGKTVVPEIDPTVPGEYVITITYPDPDPDGQDVKVVIKYVVEPPAPNPNETGYRTVSTKLKGSVDSETTTITPTASVKKGDTYVVEWSPGKDRYISSVEVDGKMVELEGNTLEIKDIFADHDIVVTVAKMPAIGSTVVPGWYTITMNKYGAPLGLDMAPSMTVDGGDDAQVWWEPAPGFEVTEVVIDGVKHLTAEEIAAGTYDFTRIAGNHVVDVRYKAIDAPVDVSQADYLVTTKVENGPGTITGGSTVAPGSEYQVAWSPVHQTTTDVTSPRYGVYEVERVTVNGDERAGSQDRLLDLTDIQGDQNVVVTMRPVLYNVNVYAYSVKGGKGTVAGNRTLFKGQGYEDIWGTPDAGSRIVRVVVDGEVVFDEATQPAPGPEGGESGKSGTPETASIQSLAADVTALSASDGDAADDAAEGATDGAAGSDDAAADEPGANGTAQKSDAATQAAPAAGDKVVELEGLADAADADGSDGSLQPVALRASNAAPEPVFPPEVKTPRTLSTAQSLYDITGVQSNHRVEVYFAGKDDPYTPEDIDKAKEDTPTITPSFEGGPGKVTIITPGDDPDGTPTENGVVDPTKPTILKWDDIPSGSEPVKVIVNGEEIEITPEMIEDGQITLPPGTVKPGDNDIRIVVEKKRLPDDDVVVVEQDKPTGANAAKTWSVSTQITGGKGTITSSAEIDEGGNYTVTWKAEEGYRIVKILIDGVEYPDLLATDHYTFFALDGNHSIQVVLEPIPEPDQPAPAPLPDDEPDDPAKQPGDEPTKDPVQPSQPTTDGTASDGGDQGLGQQTTHTALAKTGDQSLPAIAFASLIAAAAAALLVLQRQRRRS